MRLSIDDIMTYIDCPMKYSNSIDKNLKEEFTECIHKTIYSYYYNIMNESQCSLYDMRKKWGSLWYKNKSKEDIMFSNSNNIRNELGIRGANIVTNFYNSIIQVPSVPIAIEQEYCINIGEHYLTGSIKLIREVELNQKRYIELVDFRTDEVMPDNFVVKYDLSLTAQSYAFRKLFNAKEDHLLLYFLHRDKQYITERDKKVFTNFEVIIDNVAKSISSKYFYPKYSLNCRGCSYQRQCKIT